MNRENPQGAPDGKVARTAVLSPDARRFLDALLATATGTMAGILADSGFSVRMSIVNAVYRFLGPLFDVFSAYPNGQLLLAGFIFRIPIVLMVGLLVGLILGRMRYPRLLLLSILVWLVYLVGRRLVFVLPLLIGASGGNASSFAQTNFIPELVGYSMQYAFLILVIYTTNSILIRSQRHKVSTE